jgi:hypothetical protein
VERSLREKYLTMKRSEPAEPGRNDGSVDAQNIEEQLEEIRRELAWMIAEQEEMTRWIDALGMDDKYDSPP